MSFVNEEDIMTLTEEMLKKIFKDTKGVACPYAIYPHDL